MHLVSHSNAGDTRAQLNQQSAIPRQVYSASGTQLAPLAWIALCCAITHIKLPFTTLYASCKCITQPSLDTTLSFHCSLFVTFNSPALHSHTSKTKSSCSTSSCNIRKNLDCKSFCSFTSSFEWQL